ncbi:hypothetical protein N665_2494s0003 [Sinapis alba]|nr:hypothetical protein N665_2494s0003 [Sinapis alba]
MPLPKQKIRTHSKQSSFHSLISRSKKSHKADKACQTDDIPSNEYAAPIEEDEPSCHSPVLSQHAKEHYRSPIHTTSIHTPPVHTIADPTSPIHTSPIHTSPIHTSPIHTSPIHTSPIHTSPVHTSSIHPSPVLLPSSHTSPNRPAITISPSTTLQTPTLADPPSTQPQSPAYDTSARQLNLQESPSKSRSISSLQALNFGDVESHSSISPDPQTPTQPKYDSSTLPASHRDTLLYTPKTSPNKSSENAAGFAVHASSVNAFAATATSKPVHQGSEMDIEVCNLSALHLWTTILIRLDNPTFYPYM